MSSEAYEEALKLAVFDKYTDLIKILLKYSGDYDYTCIAEAISDENHEIVKMLLDEDKKNNSYDDDEETKELIEGYKKEYPGINID